MVSPDWWATYGYTNNQWLLQGWEIANGALSKVAETQVDLWPGYYSNPNWDLVEHPAGGVAFIGLRGPNYNSSDAIGMTHYGMRDGQFELIDSFEIPLQSPGWDLMYCTRDFAYFVSQSATYQTDVAPWEIRSLRDLSLVASGDSLAPVLAPGQGVSKSPYFCIGNTFWFDVYTPPAATQHLKGLKMLQGGGFTVIDPQGQDHVGDPNAYVGRYVNSVGGHLPRRDRWAVFAQHGVGYSDTSFQYELNLLDENGNAVFVQFPVLDSTYKTSNQYGTIPMGIIVLQVFLDAPASDGSQVAHWFGMASRQPSPGAWYEPHRFSGSFTIPNVANGSAVVTTTWQDLGIYGAPDPNYPGAYLPAPAGFDSRGPWVTSSPVMLLNSQDDAFDNYDYDLHALYQMTVDGQAQRIETIDLGNYGHGWGGWSLSTMSPAVFPPRPIPRVDSNLAGELKDLGQRFD